MLNYRLGLGKSSPLSFTLFHICVELISFESDKKLVFKRSGILAFLGVYSSLVPIDTKFFSAPKQILFHY